MSIGLARKFYLLALAGAVICASMPGAAGASLQSRIDAVLRAAYPDRGPGAAVLVAQGNRLVLRKGYGWESLERRTSLPPGGIFRIASITKQFTAVSILQLAAAGKLRLDDELARYLPDFPTGGERITLAQLLTHTSGLRNYSASDAFRAAPRQEFSLAQLFGFVKDQPLNFRPGTDWAYCNTGYVLLGAVIERVSGQSYEDYLRDHVFGPAGLRHTAYDHASGVVPGRIPGYSRAVGGAWVDAEYLNVTHAYAAGGLVSDVDDLWRWEQALQDGRILRPDLLALARTPVRVTGSRRTADYGFGWELGSIGGHATAGHGGTISGFRTYEVAIPELGGYVAILCNSDQPPADPEDVAARIGRMIADEVPAAGWSVASR